MISLINVEFEFIVSCKLSLIQYVLYRKSPLKLYDVYTECNRQTTRVRWTSVKLKIKFFYRFKRCLAEECKFVQMESLKGCTVMNYILHTCAAIASHCVMQYE